MWTSAGVFPPFCSLPHSSSCIPVFSTLSCIPYTKVCLVLFLQAANISSPEEEALPVLCLVAMSVQQWPLRSSSLGGTLPLTAEWLSCSGSHDGFQHTNNSGPWVLVTVYTIYFKSFHEISPGGGYRECPAELKQCTYKCDCRAAPLHFNHVSSHFLRSQWILLLLFPLTVMERGGDQKSRSVT